MNFWLVKTEPDTYGWEDLVNEGNALWDGVRNYQARNFMREMKKGDLVFIYHSGKKREVVGIAELTKESFPDPTTDDERWIAVKMKAKELLANPVSLSTIKTNPGLSELHLVRHSRLSVMPVTKAQFNLILEASKEGDHE